MESSNCLKSRINYIDYAKAIGILLVIIGHLVPEELQFVKTYIYAFHMPLFFVISGILYSSFSNKIYNIKY